MMVIELDVGGALQGADGGGERVPVCITVQYENANLDANLNKLEATVMILVRPRKAIALYHNKQDIPVREPSDSERTSASSSEKKNEA